MLKIGVFSRNPESWPSQQLRNAILYYRCEPVFLRHARILNRIGYGFKYEAEGVNLEELAAIIIRPIGRCSLEEAIYRLDAFHRLARNGKIVINHPSAIEKCIDKFYSLFLLEEHGLPVPRTAVTENANEAIRAFHELGEDVVVKPIFGSRGIGVTRINDADTAIRIFHALQFYHNVMYLQEFIQHGQRDIRMFVIGGEVIAAMYRESEGWKTNIAQGARPVAFKPGEELRELAVKACKILNCEVAGVDVLESPKGYFITEINSQPGWRGLQSVTKINIAKKIIGYVLEKVRK